MYLTKATETFVVSALDQNGQPFEGDLSTVTVTSDQPGFVGASLSPFANGNATLTLTQGTPGIANITIGNGTIFAGEQVESYVPELAKLEIGPAS